MKRNIKILLSFAIILYASILLNNNYILASKRIDATSLNDFTKSLNKYDYYTYEQNTFHPRNSDDAFGDNNKKYPIYRVDINKNDTERQNNIALTFDSAYINDYTYTILDILDKYDAKCTFFMTSEWAKNNPEHIKEISRRGHEIGNHSNTHPNFTTKTKEKIVKEVTDCHNTIKSILGIDMCLFRFPYGAYNDEAVNTLTDLGYYPIQWTFDSLDWKNESKEKLFSRFYNSQSIVPGAIILCHNGATYTPDALPYIMELFKTKGLKCVKVSDLIYHHNFTIENGVQTHKIDKKGNMIGDDSEKP